MSNKDAIGKMSEEMKQRLMACKTREEAEKVLAEECGTPIDDELLDEIAGGYDRYWGYDSRHPYPQGDKPSVIA